MKLSLFVFLVAIALATSSPVPTEPLKIVKSSFDLHPEGTYQFGFETENKIIRDEVGEVKNVKNEEGKDEQVIVMRGSFSYLDPEGKTISVVFVADETGFHPEGAHLPVAPPA